MAHPRVLAVIDRVNYCAWWRILWPFVTLRAHGYEVDCVLYTNLPTVEPDTYDLIITPRVTFGDTHWLTGWLQRAGKTWVYETDDDLWSPEFTDRQVDMVARDGSRPERRRARREFDHQREQRIQALQRCDGITVSTATLAERLDGVSQRPIEVVPNLIDVRSFMLAMGRQERMVNGLTVGWAGGGRMASDFEPLGQAWGYVARRHPEVTFVIYGHEAEALMSNVPEDQLAIIEWAEFAMYPAGLKNIDIGCCVLPDDPWNTAKSAIKWMEMSLAGAATVCSPTVYGEVVRADHDALLATTTLEWVTQIERLIASAELRDYVVTNARAKVSTKHNLAIGWKQWPDAWERLLRVRS